MYQKIWTFCYFVDNPFKINIMYPTVKSVIQEVRPPADFLL